MAIEGIRIGPFIGGLNTASDPTSIGDTDLAVLENLELDPDGSLVSRPPIVDTGVPLPAASITPAVAKILGHYVTPQGGTYLIAHNGSKTYYFTGSNWVEVCNFPASAITQYRDKLWLLAAPGTTHVGGSWDLASGFSTVSAMPKGAAIIAHKERLWIALGPMAEANGTRLYYSEVGNPTDWPGGGNFLNVNAGDGQNIVAMYLYFNDLLIFKTRSSYRFSYSSSPDSGVVSKVSETIGAASIDSVVPYEGSLYVVFSDKVYEVVNYNFVQINNKVPLTSSSYPSNLNYTVSISVWADRLIVNYFGTTYVYGLKTSSWTVWSSKLIRIAKVVSTPVTYLAQRPNAYLVSADAADRRIFSVQEDLIEGRTEDIDCIARTKNYDYQSAHTFKKLAWWGIDVIIKGAVRATVTPIVETVRPTWNQLRNYTWAQLNTWNNPIDIPIEINDQVVTMTSGDSRKFIKMLKALRFRQVNYQVTFNVDGTPKTAPAKLFSLTTFVGVKERVSKKVS